MEIEIRDIETNQKFRIDASENTAIVRVGGDKVKVHPVAIRTMVRTGQKFDGHTIRGPRTMERVT